MLAFVTWNPPQKGALGCHPGLHVFRSTQNLREERPESVEGEYRDIHAKTASLNRKKSSSLVLSLT
jgi:hypothetical protein